MAAPRNGTNQQQHTEKFYKGSHSDTPWNKVCLCVWVCVYGL